MIALPSDVGRAAPAVRAAYGHLLEAMVGLFERAIPAGGSEDRRTTAMALAALSVGGMVLARTVPDADLGVKVQGAALAKALEILMPNSA